MELKTNEEKQLYGMLITIVREMGCKREAVKNYDAWELQDLIIKDIHIARITKDQNKKTIQRLTRNLNVLKQKTFPFVAQMKEYN